MTKHAASIPERLHATIRAEGGLLAGALAEPDDLRAIAADSCRYGMLAAAGPRTNGHDADYELLVEAIHEGYLLHYGTPRVLVPSERDLALLAGDRLYALGLARLAEIGDLDAVRELADVISLCAHVHSSGAAALAQPIWNAGATAVGWGSSDAHARAKQLVRADAADARAALEAVGPPSAVARDR